MFIYEQVGDSPDVLSESTGDTDDTALTMEDPNNVYLHLQQVVAQFEDPTYSSSFISDILHLIPRAMKLDKQARLQQVRVKIIGMSDCYKQYNNEIL